MSVCRYLFDILSVRILRSQLSKIYFNIISRSKPWFPKRSDLSMTSVQNRVFLVSLVISSLIMPLDFSIMITGVVQTMKLLISRFSPAFCYSSSFRFACSPQYSFSHNLNPLVVTLSSGAGLTLITPLIHLRYVYSSNCGVWRRRAQTLGPRSPWILNFV